MVQPGTTGMRAGGGGSTAAMRGAGRGTGSGVALGAVVCGAEIEPVISAAACSRRSEILAICAVRRLVGLLEARLQRGDFLAELGDRLLHRLVLFDAATSGCARGVEKPPLASAPTTAPSAAANVTEAASSGIALVARPARQSAAASRRVAPLRRSARQRRDRRDRLDRRRRVDPLQSRRFGWPATAAAIRQSAIRSWLLAGVASRLRHPVLVPLP